MKKNPATGYATGREVPNVNDSAATSTCTPVSV